MPITIFRKVTVTGGTVLRAANNLGDVASAATSRANLAVLGIAANLSDVASAATAFANIKQPASTSATGAVELATADETWAGESASLVPPAAATKAAVSRALAALVVDGEAARAYLQTLCQDGLYDL